MRTFIDPTCSAVRREGMPSRTMLLLGVTALLFALWLGGFVALKLRRLLESSASSQRARRGLRGERKAEALLARHGYRVVARQVAGTYDAQVDGQAQPVSLSADLLVERQGATWIVEVKTGPHAPRFEHVDTRRQLLEYQLAFGGDAVLLVDPERESIREIRFPLPAIPTPFTRRSAPGLTWWLALAGVAIIAWRIAMTR